MHCWSHAGLNVEVRELMQRPVKINKYDFGSVLSDLEIPKIIYFGPDVTEDEVVEMYGLFYPKELVFVPLKSQNEGYAKVLKTIERMITEYDFPARLVMAYGDEICDGVIHLRAFSETVPSEENELSFYKIVPGLEGHMEKVYSDLVDTRSDLEPKDIDEQSGRDSDVHSYFIDKEDFMPGLRVSHSGPVDIIYGDLIDLFRKGYIPLEASVSKGQIEEIQGLIDGFRKSHGEFLAALGVEKIEGLDGVLVRPYELLPIE